MFQTLAYYATVFHRSFTAYTSRHLQALGLNFGSLFPVIYVGKHPGCTQAQLTREKSGRAYHLDLSPKGQQAFQVSHQVFFDWDEAALAPLDQKEREQLFALLAKVSGKEADSTCTKPFAAP